MIKRFFIYLACAFLLISCGYKSTAVLSREVLGQNVYVDVTMSRIDPQNTVLVKDAISSALVDKFGSKIVDKDRADTKLYVQLQSVEFNPLVYDSNGYVISYRAVSKLKIECVFASGEKETVNTSGNYDFPIAADSIISDTKRFEAIRFASADAIDEFTAIIAIKGLKANGRK